MPSPSCKSLTRNRSARIRQKGDSGSNHAPAVSVARCLCLDSGTLGKPRPIALWFSNGGYGAVIWVTLAIACAVLLAWTLLGRAIQICESILRFVASVRQKLFTMQHEAFPGNS